MTNYLLIFLSGGLGSVSRFIVAQKFVNFHISNYPFPLATLTVNSIGSLVAGLLIGFAGREHSLTPYMLAGFLGGFTTFSAFSLEVVEAMKESRYALAFIVVASNVILGILLCFLGYSLTKNIST